MMQPIRAQSPKHTNSSCSPVSTQSGWAEDPDGHLSKADGQKATRHMKRRSAGPAIREMQIQTSVRHFLTPARMAIIRMFKYQILERLLRKGIPPPPIRMLLVGNADWYSHFEKQSTDYWPFLTAFHSVQKRLQKGTGQGGKVDEYRTRRWNIGVKGQDRGVSPKMVLPISQNNRNCSRFMNTGSRSPGLEGHGENPLIISTVCVKEPQAVLQAGGTRLATSCLQSVTWNSLPGLSSGNWGLFGLLQESFFL